MKDPVAVDPTSPAFRNSLHRELPSRQKDRVSYAPTRATLRLVCERRHHSEPRLPTDLHISLQSVEWDTAVVADVPSFRRRGNWPLPPQRCHQIPAFADRGLSLGRYPTHRPHTCRNLESSSPAADAWIRAAFWIGRRYSPKPPSQD